MLGHVATAPRTSALEAPITSTSGGLAQDSVLAKVHGKIGFDPLCWRSNMLPFSSHRVVSVREPEKVFFWAVPLCRRLCQSE